MFNIQLALIIMNYILSFMLTFLVIVTFVIMGLTVGNCLYYLQNKKEIKQKKLEDRIDFLTMIVKGLPHLDYYELISFYHTVSILAINNGQKYSEIEDMFYNEIMKRNNTLTVTTTKEIN